MYNTFLRKLIKRTARSCRKFEGYYRRRERYLQKPSFLARVSRYRSYYEIVLSLKSAEKRAITTCYRSFPSSLRRISGVRLVRKKNRKRSPWSDYKLRRWQTSRSNVTIASQSHIILSKFIILFHFFLQMLSILC